MRRIFNRTMQRGGRFYAQGNSWQNIAVDMRHQITIGGEATAEVDYKTLHPAILYSWTQHPLPKDSYALDGWPRDLVKRALLVIINSPTTRKAIRSIANSDGQKCGRDEVENPIATTHNRKLMQVLAKPGSKEAERLARQLVDQLTVMHTPIKHYFGKDMGANLMNIDSRMADCVMMEMLNQGVVVLPIHDSFIVPQSKVDQLEAAMMKAAHAEAFHALKIERKTAAPHFGINN